MSKNAILYNPRTLLGGVLFQCLLGILSLSFRTRHAVSLLYEMQPLYVSAKVEIISKLNKYLQKKMHHTFLWVHQYCFANKFFYFACDFTLLR